MPLKKLNLRPGINTQLSPTLNEGGWSDGNLVRFPYGVPQPIGGWAKFSATALQGICRALLAWSQLNATLNLACGTHQKLQMFSAGTLYDLTPVRETLTCPIGSVNIPAGSNVVTATLSGHGCNVGDFLEIPAGTTLGGVAIAGEQVVTAATSTTFSFVAPASSTAGGTNTAAAIVVVALISPGSADAVLSNGFGAGAFGSGAYGTPSSTLVSAAQPRLWSLDHWGEQLIACPRGGSIYTWLPANGTAVRAAIISSNAPTQVLLALVGMPERHLIAFGCSLNGAPFDPMLVAWCDVEDYTDWTATAQNSAGSFRLAAGNSIIGALAVSQEILIWTESNVYSMQFIGSPLVFSFNAIEGDHTGLIAQNAAVTAGNGLVFWMGLECFWTYNGAAMPLKCDVWDAVFENLNRQQVAKIVAGSNAAFGEVWWCYPSAASIENDSIVIFNYLTLTWSKGSLARTALIDTNVLGTPLMAAPNGYVYTHEFGVDADGSPLGASVTTGFTDIADGEEIPFLEQVMPDFSAQQGAVTVQVDAKRFPDDPVAKTRGPFSITAATRYLSPRLRGRQINMVIASAGTGSFWRLGGMRVRIKNSGRQ